LDRLISQFRGNERKHIIGTHAAAPGNTTLFGAFDFDNKDKDAAKYRKNSKAAKALYASLVEEGFHPLLTKSGGGSYHFRVLFSSPVPAEQVREFLTSQDVEAEVFPKTRDVRITRKKLGGWLRLPGRHHNREYWSKVWDGSRWLSGDAAIDLILGLKGDDPALAGCETAPTPSTGQVYVDNAEDVAVPRPSSLASTLSTYTSRRECGGGDVCWRQVEMLATRHQPAAVGQRDRKLFLFAQAVKGLSGNMDATLQVSGPGLYPASFTRSYSCRARASSLTGR
jgi:hypothetical protein